MDQYEVGQILYTTSKSSFKIIPIQVIEEVTRTTIKGTEKTYMVCFPNENKTVVDINKIKGEIFKTTASVQEYLIENTRQAIQELVKEAHIIESDAFGSNSSKKDSKTNEVIYEKNLMQQDSQSDIIKVDLGNGQVGRISKDQIKS